MKGSIRFAPMLATLACALISCGEDRTGEYMAKTEVDNWIESQMREIYLYYQEMPQLESRDYFNDPETFFGKILASHDDYSYIVVPEQTKTRNNILPVTYGFDFVLVSDPTRTSSRQVARVLQVLPQSPADQAGLHRGDYIVQLDGSNLSASRSSLLQTGGGGTLTILPLVYDEEADLPSWGQDTLQIDLTAAVGMENNPFYLSTVIEHDGKRIGYLVYNEFRTGADETDQTYLAEMLQVFRQFKQQGVDEFILDLRYNQGGQVTCAQLLAALLAPASCLGQEFAYLAFNDKRTDANYSLYLPTEYADCNLNLERLFIISGLYTASASEMMVNCLRPYMTVNLIGQRTVGKNVGMTRTESPYGFTMYPVTCTVYNCHRESDYASGFTPEYVISELNYHPWRELGDTQEILLRNTLQWIAGGVPEDAENVSHADENQPVEPGDGTTAETDSTTVRLRQRVVPIQSSLDDRGFPAAILP